MPSSIPIGVSCGLYYYMQQIAAERKKRAPVAVLPIADTGACDLALERLSEAGISPFVDANKKLCAIEVKLEDHARATSILKAEERLRAKGIQYYDVHSQIQD